MKAVLIGVGDEVLYGETVNTNASYLAKELSIIGFEILYHAVVSDDEDMISDAVTNACAKAELVITTGGLGPTKDDKTKQVVAETLGLPMYCDNDVKAKIEQYFKKRERCIVEGVSRQYMMPEGCIVLPNETGTAPGVYIKQENTVVICLPGPPAELNPMFENYVKPLLTKITQKEFVERYYMTCGIGESPLEKKVRAAVSYDLNYSINTYLSRSGVMLKAVAKGHTLSEAENTADKHDKEIKSVIEEYLYSESRKEVWQAVAEKLMEKNITLSCAESCTGGHFTDLLVENAGISAVFPGSVVTYSNETKMKLLGVSEEILDNFGAVSKECAIQMAEGARNLFKTDCAVAITGYAGPEQGENQKNQGLVYICVNFKGKIKVAHYIFPQKRVIMQHKSATHAFKILNELLKSD